MDEYFNVYRDMRPISEVDENSPLLSFRDKQNENGERQVPATKLDCKYTLPFVSNSPVATELETQVGVMKKEGTGGEMLSTSTDKQKKTLHPSVSFGPLNGGRVKHASPKVSFPISRKFSQQPAAPAQTNYRPKMKAETAENPKSDESNKDSYDSEKDRLIKELEAFFSSSSAKVISTVVKRDGIGDLGQLNNLYEYILTLSENIRPDVRWGVLPCLTIKDMESKFPIFQSSPMKRTVDSNTSITVLHDFFKEGVSNKDFNWLEYPATNNKRSTVAGNTLHTRILEMGMKRETYGGKKNFKTGELDCGIGYGFVDKFKKREIKEMSDEEINKIKNVREIKDIDIIANLVKKRKTWLCSFKEFAKGSGITEQNDISQMYESIDRSAKKADVKLIIWIGKFEGKRNDNRDIVLGMLSQPQLDCIMQNMNSDSMVISGGEGLYTRALGIYSSNVKERAVPVLAARYDFQYKEIAFSLFLNSKYEPKEFKEIHDKEIFAITNKEPDEKIKPDKFSLYYKTSGITIDILSGKEINTDKWDLKDKQIYTCTEYGDFQKLMALNSFYKGNSSTQKQNKGKAGNQEVKDPIFSLKHIDSEKEYRDFLNTFKSLAGRFIKKNWFKNIDTALENILKKSKDKQKLDQMQQALKSQEGTKSPLE